MFFEVNGHPFGQLILNYFFQEIIMRIFWIRIIKYKSIYVLAA